MSRFLGHFGGVSWPLRAICIAGVTLAVPAAAQDGPANHARADDIVVEGRRDRDKQLQDFVRGLSFAPNSDSLARWDGSDSCPLTIGLQPADNKAITDRIRRVAAAAKIPLAPAGCNKWNILVIFTDDKAAMVKRLEKQVPDLFVNHRGDLIRIRKEAGPALAWHVNGMVSRDGQLLPSGGDAPAENRTALGATRLAVAARPIYLVSVVVIEIRGTEGLTRTQLADYAAMRAYSDADPAKADKTGAPTILTVLTAPIGSATPPSMTTWDFSFLKGLYASQAVLYANAQRGAIVETMKRELDGTKE